MQQIPVIRKGFRLNLRLKFWFWGRIPTQPPLALPHSQFQQLLVVPLADSGKVPDFDSSSFSHPTADRMSFGCSFDLLSLVRQRCLFWVLTTQSCLFFEKLFLKAWAFQSSFRKGTDTVRAIDTCVAISTSISPLPAPSQAEAEELA